MKIKKITKVQNIHTYDFEVENNHHYLMENGVISHNTSTSIAMDASAGVQPSYNSFFFEDNINGLLPVTSMYLQENPILYSYVFGMYDQAKLTKMIGRLQIWMDTGISAEYVIDKNFQSPTAKQISDLYDSSWEEGNKGVYYLRTIKQNEKKGQDDSCVACAG